MNDREQKYVDIAKMCEDNDEMAKAAEVAADYFSITKDEIHCDGIVKRNAFTPEGMAWMEQKHGVICC